MSQYYVGVKIIMAWPEEKDGKQGYSVKYPDGYVSWSPKDVFEGAYFPMGETNNNRVTPEMVNAFTGKVTASKADERTVLVKSEAPNGFVQYETASCVDPTNFDINIGTDVALERVKDALWKCLGFVVLWGKFGLKKED